jgi:branched-chain amino acid transport system ATP-binding protein
MMQIPLMRKYSPFGIIRTMNCGQDGALLETVEITKTFDHFCILDRVNLRIVPGEIRALIGPNGAGKSTLLSVISGECRPDSGKILFHGREITRCAPHIIARLGLVRTFQISNLFENLTVKDSLRGALARGRLRSVSCPELEEALALMGLNAQADHAAAELSHGERRLLEIGLAVAQQPRLLLLDEPTAGLSPQETHRVIELVRTLTTMGCTILLVEHDLSVIRALADHVTVLHQGRVLAEGTPDEIARDERVQHTYSFSPSSLPVLNNRTLC